MVLGRKMLALVAILSLLHAASGNGLFKTFGGQSVESGHAFRSRNLLQDYYYYEDYVPADLADCLTMYEIVNATTGLGFMTDALYVTGLAETFDDPLLQATLFAPTDQAFAAAAKALNQTEDALLNDPVLLPILLYHVLSVPVLVEELQNAEIIETFLGQNVTVNVTTENADAVGALTVEQEEVSLIATESEAEIIAGDARSCTGGLVHVLDEVLLPQILNSSVSGSTVTINIGNGTPGGPVQVFQITFEGALPPRSFIADLVPAPAPSAATKATTKAASAPTTTTAASAASAAKAGPAAASTSSGSTYYLNSGSVS